MKSREPQQRRWWCRRRRGVVPVLRSCGCRGAVVFQPERLRAGQIAAVNANGVLNNAANPVPVGGYISLYATGEGQTVPAGTDGALAMTVYPKPVCR